MSLVVITCFIDETEKFYQAGQVKHLGCHFLDFSLSFNFKYLKIVREKVNLHFALILVIIFLPLLSFGISYYFMK